MVTKEIVKTKTEKKAVKKATKTTKKPIKKEVKTINYDATNMVLGRLCSVIAKKLMLGYKINVYNVEKCVMTGDPKLIFKSIRKN